MVFVQLDDWSNLWFTIGLCLIHKANQSFSWVNHSLGHNLTMSITFNYGSSCPYLRFLLFIVNVQLYLQLRCHMSIESLVRVLNHNQTDHHAKSMACSIIMKWVWVLHSSFSGEFDSQGSINHFSSEFGRQHMYLTSNS